jgi:hypothetical protein
VAQQDHFLHDLFISYTKADQAWVQGCLIPALGLPVERVTTPQDFRLGVPVADAFEYAVIGSRYTVLVLSPAYLNDEWPRFSEQLSTYVSVTEQRERLIPLLLEPCVLPLRIDFRVRLDCTDMAHWDSEISRLCILLNQTESRLERISRPYPGMKPFGAPDTHSFTHFFYGRETEIEGLLRRLRHPTHLFVIGPSGSGKSSLISAGLLPKLPESQYFSPGFWLVREMHPGDHPMHTLAQVLSGDLSQPAQALTNLLASSPPAQRLLLVIDRFEEIFTQPTPEEQKSFILAPQVFLG